MITDVSAQEDLNKAVVLQLQDGTYRSVGVPQFLYLKCEKCKRYKRVSRLRAEIAKSGPLEGKRLVVGNCSKCGEEVSSSINTQAERDQLVQRSVYYWQKDKRELDKKLAKSERKVLKRKMPKNSTKAKTTAVKNKTKKGAEKVAATKGARKAMEAATSRPRVWERPEGAADGKTTLAAIMAGGPWTVEEMQDRHDKLAKTGKYSVRGRDLVTSDYTWMVKQDKIEVDGVEHQAYRGRNRADEEVFSVPTLADPLVKGSKPGKLSKAGGKITFNGIDLTKDKAPAAVKRAPATTKTTTKSSAKAEKKTKKSSKK